MTSRSDPRSTSFDETDHYDTARPPYPNSVFGQIALGARLGRALDVGCGTGIPAAALAEREWDVLGIEPDGCMAALARARGIAVVELTFEGWEPQHALLDLVVSAQAWHWIDRVVGARKAAAVLAPGGHFVATWNSHRHESEIAQLMRRVYTQYRDRLTHRPRPSACSGDVIDLAEADLLACAMLGNVERRASTMRKEYPVEEWLRVQQPFGFPLPTPAQGPHPPRGRPSTREVHRDPGSMDDNPDRCNSIRQTRTSWRVRTSQNAALRCAHGTGRHR